jgi:S-formylglutathione hydrolase FrmB
MGGGGSVVYAQRHPEMFNACYSTSGLLDHRYKLIETPHDEIEWRWSVAETSPVEFLRHATAEQLEKLRTVRWMLDCGDDDSLIQTNLDFFTEMKRENVAVEFRIRDGVHDWKFWREALPLILNFSFKKE